MNPKILIIDDDLEIRELYKSFLDNQGYDVKEAVNGQEAFNMVTNETFDLYVTDLFMPQMNGVEFLKTLKMLDPDAVVIILTGYDNMEYTKQALDYGAFRFITKPVKMADFLAVIKLGLVERKKLQQTTPIQKLKRAKDKINLNIEYRENIFAKLKSFLLSMENKNLSYIEIGGPGSRQKAWGKVFSAFKPLPLDYSFTQDEINLMILCILSDDQLNNLIINKTIRANFEFEDDDITYRYRLIIYFEMDELVIGLKFTRRTLLPIDNMRLPSTVLNSLTFKKENTGLIIVSGPPGSGKSSFIDAIVNVNNSYLPGSIFIIGDSIEYFHESKNSVIRHQELYRDINSLNDALSQCMNYLPNLVVIEDIQSAEILEAVIKLVDTGCLVIATLKSRSVVEVIYKMLSFYAKVDQGLVKKNLARTLSSIICLQLLPSSTGKRVPVKEIMVNNDQLSSVISSGNIDEIYDIIQRSKKAGMHTMEQDLVQLVKAGSLSVEIAAESANNSHLLKNMLQYS